MSQTIRLRGITGDILGKVWEADSTIRVGRNVSLEIVLEDGSVSDRHAEFKLGSQGWTIRDLDSLHGTFVNGKAIGTEERLLRSRDIVQIGLIALMVVLNESVATAA